MKTTYLLGITVSEFQAWYHSGELRLARQRLVAVPLEGDGHPVLDELRRDELLVSLPYVDVENEQDVLIALVALESPPSLPQAPRSGSAVPRNVSYLSIACLLALYPLTQRALRLLGTRLDSYKIRLAQPIFEPAVQELWSEWIRRRALRGAATLPRLVTGHEYTPSARLKDEALAARQLMDNPSSPPGSAPGLLARVFTYNRHKHDTADDIWFVIDFGIAANDLFKADPRLNAILDALREFCRDKDRKWQPLHEILSSSAFSRVLGECHNVAACPVRMESLILFLKWKYRAQRADKVVVAELRETARQCAALRAGVLDDALWLFGLYCGFEQIAGQLYAQSPDLYRFIDRPTHRDDEVVSKPPVPMPGIPPVQPLPPPPVRPQKQQPPVQPPVEGTPQGAQPPSKPKAPQKKRPAAQPPDDGTPPDVQPPSKPDAQETQPPVVQSPGAGAALPELELDSSPPPAPKKKRTTSRKKAPKSTSQKIEGKAIEGEARP